MTAAGLIQAFAANAPQRTDRGLVIEPAAANLLLHSTALLNPAWIQDGGASAAASPYTDPAGGANAVRLTLNGGLKQWYQILSAGVGNYTLSAYVRAAAGTTNVRLNQTRTNGYTPSDNLAVNTDWQRLVYPFSIAASLVNISLMTAAGGVTSPIDAWGVQFEAGSAPTSPITTATAHLNRRLRSSRR